MPAMDLDTINRLGRELHPASNGLMDEHEVCPWTLFLTMALTLLKGVLPHVPRMLPVFIQDEELREKAAETFMSEDFQNNIEEYFIQNIKSDIQAPLNRQILKSSETVMYGVDIMNNLVKTFLGPNASLGDIIGSATAKNDDGTTDNMPRYNSGGLNMLSGGTLGKVINFARTLYDLTK